MDDNDQLTVTEEIIRTFEKIQSQMFILHEEVSILSKKNPETPINKFKIKFVNQLLLEANAILENNNKPFSDFETFDEDLLPTNSDVVMMLSQYLSCLEKYRSDRIKGSFGDWYWITEDGDSKFRTTSPQKLRAMR